ncbi:unnamed protein product, partial [Didymodactylos carnosus]
VADSIGMANGIYSSSNMELIYVAASLEKKIHVYKRDTKNNSLKLLHSLNIPGFPDNLFINDQDQLLIGGHPKSFLFLLHSLNSHKYQAPSQVLLYREPEKSTYIFVIQEIHS